MRLSAHLAHKHKLSRRYIKFAISAGRVSIDGKPVKKDIDLTDMTLNICLQTPKTSFQYDLKDYLIKETQGVVFLYKPPLIHTERHTPDDDLCLDDILNENFTDHKLISRLDYGVDGVIAAVPLDYEILTQRKYYFAWVEGEFPDELSGRWSVDAHKKRKVSVSRDYNGAFMEFQLMKSYNGLSLVDVQLEYAHRHQVRSVLAHIGYPIVWDNLYGNSTDNQRVALHCYKVEINNTNCECNQTEDFRKLMLNN